jgi:hypothetical protein
VSTGEVRVDYGKVMERVRATIDKIYDEDDSPEALAKLGIDTIVGRARFLAPKTVTPALCANRNWPGGRGAAAPKTVTPLCVRNHSCPVGWGAAGVPQLLSAVPSDHLISKPKGCF